MIALITPRSAPVFTVSETWLKEEIADDEIAIDGYNLLREDRNHANGGGTTAYIHNKYGFKRRLDLELLSTEVLWFEVLIPKSKSILMASIYRPSSNESFYDEFRSQLQVADRHAILKNSAWGF